MLVKIIRKGANENGQNPISPGRHRPDRFDPGDRYKYAPGTHAAFCATRPTVICWMMMKTTHHTRALFEIPDNYALVNINRPPA